MPITQAFNNALSGLSATSRMAEITSANLANALTEGYARRTVELSARIVGDGAGVQITGISRRVDPNLLTERRLADADLARADVGAKSLRRLEAVFGAPGAASSLSARVADLETALVSSAADPSSTLRLEAAGRALADLTGAVWSASRGIATLRQEADAAIGRGIEALNTDLAEVARLNDEVSTALALRQDAAGLMDQRQRVIDRIATQVSLREVPQEGGRVGLVTTGGQMLLDRRPVVFGFDPSPVITADMTLAGGGLSGLTVNGEPAVPAGAGRLIGGSLAAEFRLRDVTLVEAQSDLDAFAADLIARFEDPATDPTRPPGAPGLLTDQGAVLDPGNITGLADRIAVNPLADPATGGALFRLRDGIGAVTAGPSGSATRLQAWGAALAAPRAQPDGRIISAAEGAAGLSTSAGQALLRAERDASYSGARWTVLKDSELALGVDSDQEMQDLLKIETAYAANARVIQTLEAMMRELLEI
jgi:flagellar hook-associated protein 1